MWATTSHQKAGSAFLKAGDMRMMMNPPHSVYQLVGGSEEFSAFLRNISPQHFGFEGRLSSRLMHV